MRRYLIVDDNAALAENLAEILRDEGAEVVVVSCGSDAVAAVKTGNFDALLTDMRMPEMGGADVVHEVRAIDPALPACVMTAFTQDDELESARREGLIAVLSKPVPLREMLDLLSRARRDGLVALIEDDVALSDNLSEVLRTHGFAAVTAASVTETERLGPVTPFAALVDLRVPGGPDGAALRKLHIRFPGMPILVMTAHDERALSGGGFRVFRKPFDTSSLLGELERLHSPLH